MINERNYNLEVAAGHCSFNPERVDEIYEMAEIKVPDGRGGKQIGLSFERMVKLKSRTELNPTGDGMGTDTDMVQHGVIYGPENEIPHTAEFEERFVKETGIGIATEIMIPHIQMPYYKNIPEGCLLPWNPSIDQLGWHVYEIAAGAKGLIGLKNGKWLGEEYDEVTKPGSTTITSMEKAWRGLASYAKPFGCEMVFIHRGIDIPQKGSYRNYPIHEAVVRLARDFPEAKRAYDPSHMLGPKLRDEIVEATIEAMKMKLPWSDEFLYNFILIEAGTSKSDTEQHITVAELRYLLEELAKFRKLRGPIIKNRI